MNLRAFSFNKTLFRRNLSRYWPLWGLPAILGALFPLSFISMYFRGLKPLGSTTALHMAEFYYEIVHMAAPPVLLCYSVMVAVAVWGYLYTPRSVGLMHTLPIRREGLFLTNFLSGMVMLAIPCGAIGAFMVLYSLISHSFSPGPLLVTILCVAGLGFFYFSTATAAAFLTGNAFAMPGLYFLFHFVTPLVDALFSMLAENTIFGFQYAYGGALDCLCPTVFLINRLQVVRVLENGNSDHLRLGEGYYGSYGAGNVASVRIENVWLIGAYVLAGVVLLGIALALYRRRRSECAGDVIAMGWGKPIFRYGITALAAVSGGQLLYMLFASGFDFEGTYHILPLAVCMLAMGALGYYAASMLLAKSLHVFKGSGKGLACTAAGCLLLCCVMGFDVFGIARRVPSLEQVRNVSVYVADNNYDFIPGENDAEIALVRTLHEAILADRDYIQNHQTYPAPAAVEIAKAEASEEDGVYSPDEAGIEYQDGEVVVYPDGTVTARVSGGENAKYAFANVNLIYTLKNGAAVRRTYHWFLTPERMAEEGTADRAMDRFVNCVEIKQARLREKPGYRINGVNLYMTRRSQDYTLSNRESEQFMEAVRQDAEEGTWGTYQWFDNTQNSYAVSINVEFTREDPNNERSRFYDYITIVLRPGMTHTLQCLRDLGYVEDYDLVTNAEMERIFADRDRILESDEYGDRSVGDWERFDAANGIGTASPAS